MAAMESDTFFAWTFMFSKMAAIACSFGVVFDALAGASATV